MNPIFMDPYRPAKESTTWTEHLVDKPVLAPRWEPIRKNLGYTLTYANRMNLAAMVPRNNMASTKYCLANPPVEYLVYLPDGGEVTVDLSTTSGKLNVEWLNPKNGKTAASPATEGGKVRSFKAPFEGDAVLYIASAEKIGQ